MRYIVEICKWGSNKWEPILTGEDGDAPSRFMTLDGANALADMALEGKGAFEGLELAGAVIRVRDCLFVEAREAEKQRSRDDDERALASGEKSAEQLRAENGKFAFPGAIVNLRSARRLW